MKNRKQVLFGIVVAIVVLLNIPLPVSVLSKAGTRDNMAAYQTLLSVFITRIGSTFAFLWDADGILEEKRRMQEEIANLRFQMQELKALDADNEYMRRLLKFRSRQRHRLIMCEVASRGGMGGWWQTLQLNKGMEHGVGPGMAVITMEGLIGRTGEASGETEATGGLLVSQRTADVLLMTDPNCKVSCRLPRTGGLGIVRGRGAALGGDADLEMLCSAEPCHMDFIPKAVKIQVGDEVVTSGLGGVYPEGLLVGTVQKVSTDKSGLYQRAEVAAAASLATVKYAFVVVPEEPKERKPAEDKALPEVRQPVVPPTRPPPETPTGTDPRIPTYKRVLPSRTNAWEGAGNP